MGTRPKTAYTNNVSRKVYVLNHNIIQDPQSLSNIPTYSSNQILSTNNMNLNLNSATKSRDSGPQTAGQHNAKSKALIPASDYKQNIPGSAVKYQGQNSMLLNTDEIKNYRIKSAFPKRSNTKDVNSFCNDI